jgi:hypothetical protein
MNVLEVLKEKQEGIELKKKIWGRKLQLKIS